MPLYLRVDCCRLFADGNLCFKLSFGPSQRLLCRVGTSLLPEIICVELVPRPSELRLTFLDVLFDRTVFTFLLEMNEVGSATTFTGFADVPDQLGLVLLSRRAFGDVAQACRLSSFSADRVPNQGILREMKLPFVRICGDTRVAVSSWCRDLSISYKVPTSQGRKMVLKR